MRLTCEEKVTCNMILVMIPRGDSSALLNAGILESWIQIPGMTNFGKIPKPHLYLLVSVEYFQQCRPNLTCTLSKKEAVRVDNLASSWK